MEKSSLIKSSIKQFILSNDNFLYFKAHFLYMVKPLPYEVLNLIFHSIRRYIHYSIFLKSIY